MPVQCSDQLGYEATDVGRCSFVGSYFPVRNESMNKMINEMNHILNCRCEIMILAVMDAILAIA